jgi:hypothetical protein
VKTRPELTPIEQAMDLGAWVAAEMSVVARHSAAEWTVVCPRCSEEKLAINVRRKAFQCWRCTFAGYSPAQLIMAVLDCHPAEAGQVCAQYAAGIRALGRVDALDSEAIVARRHGDIPIAPAPPGTTWGHLDPHTAAYAHGRGIPSDHAYYLGLCSVRGDGSGSPVDHMTRGRLLIPVWLHGRFVYWVARATGDHDIKTVNLPESCNEGTHEKGPPCRGTPDCTCRHERWGLSPVPQVAGKVECLVGHHLLQPGKPAYLVEGPTDVAVCGPGFVGTMGARLALEQAFLLVEAEVSEVVILFDGDDAGYKGAKQAHDLLAPLLPVRVADTPLGRDPGDLGRATCLALGERARAGGIVAPLREGRSVNRVLESVPTGWIRPLT